MLTLPRFGCIFAQIVYSAGNRVAWSWTQSELTKLFICRHISKISRGCPIIRSFYGQHSYSLLGFYSSPFHIGQFAARIFALRPCVLLSCCTGLAHSMSITVHIAHVLLAKRSGKEVLQACHAVSLKTDSSSQLGIHGRRSSG